MRLPRAAAQLFPGGGTATRLSVALFPAGLQADLADAAKQTGDWGENWVGQVWPGFSHVRWLRSDGFSFMPPPLLAAFSLTLCSPERWQCPPWAGGVPDPVEQDPELAGKEEEGAWCTAAR